MVKDTPDITRMLLIRLLEKTKVSRSAIFVQIVIEFVQIVAEIGPVTVINSPTAMFGN